MANEIQQLEQEIEVMEAHLESARAHPTDTPQFWAALTREEQEVSQKRQRLEDLRATPAIPDEKKYPQRTNQQNKALHVLFNLLAQNLNEAGLDMRKTLKPGVEIPWSGPGVKEYLWRPVQEAQLGKRSTTELTTVEVDKVFDTINRHMGEKFGLHTPFPSIEDLLIRDQEK